GESVPSTASDGGIRFGGSNGTAYRDTPYAGASRVRKQLHNWQPSRATADADLLPDYDMLVARSRDLNRNNGGASKRASQQEQRGRRRRVPESAGQYRRHRPASRLFARLPCVGTRYGGGRRLEPDARKTDDTR